VLAADVVARRSLHPTTRIAGWGLSPAPRSSSPGWLDDPAAATRRAAEQAYAQAGIANPAEQIDILEMTDLTPALTPELLSALAFDEAGSDRVNPSGGVRANFPGIANGALRLIEAVEAISDDGGRNDGKRWSVAHSMDDLSGLVTSTASVLVLEEV
jgi:acetyl-CoA acetyltransferase